MEHPAAGSPWAPAHHSRFELAPPRRFLLPALLLLLSEEPGYGYHLAKGLQQLRFGRIDRPSVYRALAQLERDGLVESWEGTAKAGQARRLYRVTQDGERALRAWMGVIKEERDGLDLVLRRYVATGTIDAVLAEAEGSWAAVTGSPWSPVSSTSRLERRRAGLAPPVGAVGQPSAPPDGGQQIELRAGPDGEGPPSGDHRSGPATFRVVPERSALLIEARSSVGPITFGAVGVSGSIRAVTDGHTVQPGTATAARLEIEVTRLRSGNGLYDAELLRRIDARRHPLVILELHECTAFASSTGGAPMRYHVRGEITFHGSTRPIEGSVTLSQTTEGRLVVSGEQAFDIRDFDITSPTVLMLRIYPDVVVQLQVEAELEAEPVP
jgi:DNA-binding PadR family transcriptional regulator